MTYPPSPRRSPASRSRRAVWLTAALLPSLLALGRTAGAQGLDPGVAAKVAPNVLLIVDTSGSMEYESGAETFPSCYPDGSGTSERSRWVDLVEVLSGTITNYRCQAIDRASSTFTSLYQLPGSLNPPDYLYRNPYHRPLSGACGATPSTVPWSAAPTNAFDFISPGYHPYNDNAAACSVAFTQDADGLIDTFTGRVRFGLMTFDTLPNAGNGYNITAPLFSDGVAGAWSYFFSSGAAGMPAICSTSAVMEVGARNAAAPTWEGKMIPFGNPAAGTSGNTTRDSRVQDVLLSTRPYGATPIAGALTDAQTFFTLDTNPDPTSNTAHELYSAYFGPKNDPYVVAGCRDQYVILLTDGEPNLDLRPHCESGTTDPNCPYKKPEVVAAALKGLSRPIKTYVVGFADQTAPAPDSIDCTTMPASTWGLGGACDTAATEEMRVCCTLHEIAEAGGTTRAYFGNDKTALRTQLATVFNQILAGGGSATQPVRSPGVGDAETKPGSIAFRMLTSYEGGTTGVWRGTLERSRWTCDTLGLPKEEDKDASLGDDFSFNVNAHPTDRTFVTYIPAAVSGVIHSDRSVRPNISTANSTLDGIGKNDGGALAGDQTAMLIGIPPEALQPDLSTTPCSAVGSAANCKALLLPWVLGGDNGTTSPKYHRCATAATSPVDPNCSVIGDIMHSTPVIVNHPTAEIEDETYHDFRTGSLAKDRPMMVYTSSNDGFLHGFKLSPNEAGEAIVNTNASNEVFAFLPPAVLPLIDSQYPSTHTKLLDGAPVVQDVVATIDSGNAYYGYKLERSNSNAQTASSNLAYRTILVQSFGGNHSGYFALDITEPTDEDNPGTFNTDDDPKRGPRMLWQLTTDSAGNPLFGDRAATPLITTVNVDGTEVAVAVLPGGHGTPLTTYCPRDETSFPQVLGGYTPRQNVRCYTLDANNDGDFDSGDVTNYIGARSLTIVRLDSGEVLMRFRRAATGEAPTFTDTDKVLAVKLDSPITGTPAAYPVGPGAVSDRIFVGDQDGALWRVDVSSIDPTEWTMELFFDTYSKHPGVGTPSIAGPAGRPIISAPTLSVDDFGQITVAIATGDQDLSGAAGEYHYVWSLLEEFSDTAPHFQTSVNWYQELADGAHVLGPIRLNEGILYYSTFTPDIGDTNVCSLGSSTVFAVDYIRGASGNAADGGLGRLSLSTLTAAASDRVTAAELNLPVGTIIFGVNLEYAPTCFTETSGAAAMLGGTHLTASAASASTLQLAFQTGTTGTTKAGLGFKTGFETVGLNRPMSGATVESWAAILE